MTEEHNLTYKKIFLFWAPLAATWLMMSFEGPFLTAVIARMIEPKFNLAAYGVAFSFAIIIEAPVIMIMSAATALVKGEKSFKKLRNFTYFANFAITFVMLIFVIPPVFNFISIDLIGLPERVAHLTHISTIILLPWPGAIGYRRFYQGIMIKQNQTRKVAYGTVVRLVSMTVTAVILYFGFNLEGAYVGAAALTAGVVFEGIASKIMSVRSVREIRGSKIEKSDLTYKEIYDFYYPLALTSMIGLGVHPMVTFFIGQSRMSLESLAVLPVINSLVFIFRSFGLSYQEVGIAMMGEKWQGYRKLKNFGYMIGGLVVLSITVIAVTPLSGMWFNDVSGLSNELTEFALLPLILMIALPGLTFLISFQRAILVNARNTKPITYATASEVIGIITVLFVTINYFDLVGAIAAAVAYMVGRVAANIYLSFPYSKAIREFVATKE